MKSQLDTPTQNNLDCIGPECADDESLRKIRSELRHEDAITGEPGSHPLGTGIGAAVAGAAAGAVAGTALGPVGAVVGTVVGGIVGGYAGKNISEVIDPTQELEHWRGIYRSRPYYQKQYSFDQYEPAYRMGFKSYDDGEWEQIEPKLRQEWEDVSRWEGEGGSPVMSWEEAKEAARDSHERLRSRYRQNQAK